MEAASTVRARLLASAEQLGIGSDLAGLIELYDGEDCAAVQARMAQLVTERLTTFQSGIVELIEQAAQLQSSTPGDQPGPREEVARVQGRIVEVGGEVGHDAMREARNVSA
ncbi:hypothetical protein AB0D12_13100 [Streptomyces sp. NPDC048479]|uniref:hypothetical protein n=1 Tax=Streptomyces sp. NPDC048479 TaxID=3154725 RepID=UPI00341A6811